MCIYIYVYLYISLWIKSGVPRLNRVKNGAQNFDPYLFLRSPLQNGTSTAILRASQVWSDRRPLPEIRYKTKRTFPEPLPRSHNHMHGLL